MEEAMPARLLKSAIYFVALVFIFLLQITMIRDTSMWKMKLSHMLSLSQWVWHPEASNKEVITCDRSHERYDICKVNSPTLLDPTSLTLFTLSPYTGAQTHVKIHPYPRKNDKAAMSSYIKEITLTTSPPPNSTCGVTHHSPALVFSAGSYTGNFYHDINENFIPLFITINSLFCDQDVVLVVIDAMSWWFEKYVEVLSAFSPNHQVINVNNLTNTHCFPLATVGLIVHAPMIINPKLLPNHKTLLDFQDFLKKTYIRSDETPMLYPNTRDGPHLTLLSRSGNVSRVILNQEEMIKAAKEIGFNVHVLEPTRNTSMVYVYNLIHTSHVLLGMHGAGLTHLLFLRPGSVLMQVVPIGTEWDSKTYYEAPTKILGLEYEEYKIKANESSLLKTYGADSLVIKDPNAFHKGNWAKKRIYLKEQNVKLDMVRFRKCLTKAYKKATIFMGKVN